jgi:hypothetical protein
MDVSRLAAVQHARSPNSPFEMRTKSEDDKRRFRRTNAAYPQVLTNRSDQNESCASTPA